MYDSTKSYIQIPFRPIEKHAFLKKTNSKRPENMAVPKRKFSSSTTITTSSAADWSVVLFGNISFTISYFS